MKLPLMQDEGEESRRQERRYLAGRLLETRTILMTGPIGRELGEDVVSKLLFLDQEDAKAPVYIYINSPGGEVDAGYAIYDMVRFISSPVTCISTGLTASASVVVLLAAEKKRRFSLPNSRFLLHQPSMGVSGSTADIEIEAGEILKIRDRINKLIAEETGQKIETVENDTRLNFWMDAAQAKKYGLVSRIITSKDALNK